jgi:hypothetical protein
MDSVQAFYRAQIDEQAAEADRHLASSHWVDRHTGRNIGFDEREALAAMHVVDPAPLAGEEADPARHRERLIAELEVVADRFRREARDPDGYGIATIGTVIRRLRELGQEAPPKAKPPPPSLVARLRGLLGLR